MSTVRDPTGRAYPSASRISDSRLHVLPARPTMYSRMANCNGVRDTVVPSSSVTRRLAPSSVTPTRVVALPGPGLGLPGSSAADPAPVSGVIALAGCFLRRHCRDVRLHRALRRCALGCRHPLADRHAFCCTAFGTALSSGQSRVLSLAKAHHLHDLADDPAHDQKADTTDPEQWPVLYQHGDTAEHERQEHDQDRGPSCGSVAVAVVGHRDGAPFGTNKVNGVVPHCAG